MEKDKNILEEQPAPLKNSDHAFVQVGRDGHPVFPQTTEEKNAEPVKPERDATAEKR